MPPCGQVERRGWRLSAAPPSRGVLGEPPRAQMRPRASLQAARPPVHELPRPIELPLEPSPPSGPEALPWHGSPRGCWPLLACATHPHEIRAERAARTPARALRVRQPPQPPHTPTPHPLVAQRRPHAPYTRRAATPPCVARVCAGAQSCPLTSTRVEGGAPTRRGGGGTARAGRERAQVPGGWPGEHAGGARRRFQGGRVGPRKAARKAGYSGDFFLSASVVKS